MPGKFVIAKEVENQVEDWGTLRWLSNPPGTGAGQLTVIDVGLAPGKGHNFHKHPDQEEVNLVVVGKVEQWVDRESRSPWPGQLGLHSRRCRACLLQCRREPGEDYRHPWPLRRPDRL